MGKLRKIVEAKAVLSTAERTATAGLEKLLSKRERAALEPELGLFRQAVAMLALKLLSLESGLADKIATKRKY